MTKEWSWGDVETRPTMVFDYADTNSLPLRERLLQEAKEALAKAGMPQHQMLSDLRQMFKARGSDTKVFPVWKTLNRYVKIIPLSYDAMVEVLGEQARYLLPMRVNWKKVDETITQLMREGMDESYLQCFWGDITDGIEAGEMNPYYYSTICFHWKYTQRGLRVGYDTPKSKELVPIAKSVPF